MTYVRYFVFALCLLLASLNAEAKTVLKACYEDWPPYMYHNENAEHLGPVISLMDELAQRLDMEFVYSSAPYARCLRDVDIGVKDLIIGVSGQVENITNTDLPIVFWNLVPLVRKDSQFKMFLGLEQFHGNTVLVESTFTYPEKIRNWIKSGNVSTRRFQYGEASVASNLQPFKALESRDVDVFFEDQGWLETQIQHHNPAVKILLPAVVTDPNYIGLSNGVKHMLGQFNATLKSMLDDATIAKTFKDQIEFNWTESYEQSLKP